MPRQMARDTVARSTVAALSEAFPLQGGVWVLESDGAAVLRKKLHPAGIPLGRYGCAPQ
jgi:hypothetical protein